MTVLLKVKLNASNSSKFSTVRIKAPTLEERQY